MWLTLEHPAQLRRLNASHRAAEKYIGQFPSPVLSHAAKFVAFVAGSFAALLLATALVDDNLLERHLFGRNLVWCAATALVSVKASQSPPWSVLPPLQAAHSNIQQSGPACHDTQCPVCACSTM